MSESVVNKVSIKQVFHKHINSPFQYHSTNASHPFIYSSGTSRTLSNCQNVKFESF